MGYDAMHFISVALPPHEELSFASIPLHGISKILGACFQSCADAAPGYHQAAFAKKRGSVGESIHAKALLLVIDAAQFDVDWGTWLNRRRGQRGGLSHDEGKINTSFRGTK